MGTTVRILQLFSRELLLYSQRDKLLGMRFYPKCPSPRLFQLVLLNIVSCLKELITQGQPVKLDGFGTFTPTIENDGKKAKSTVEETLAMGLDELVEGIHLRFIPENSKGEELTSRELKKECVLQAAYVVRSVKKTVDGKEVKYQEKIPISSYAVATAPDDTPEP